MAVIIGSARIDENGNAHGGHAGDQTGREVSTQEFYMHSKGWIIARFKDKTQSEKCAKAMKQACNNPNIGYDQYQRDGVWAHGTASKVKTETDCSALVRRCIFEAAGIDVGNIRTITMEQALTKSGLFKPLIQYSPGIELRTGDILFTGHLGHPVSGHTVVVVEADNHTVARPTLKKGSVGHEVKLLQKNLNSLGIKDDSGNKLERDGEFGKLTDQALRRFQKIYKLEIDGIYGNKSYAAMTDALK